MDPGVAQSIARLEAVCHERQLPLTNQRRAVFEVLLDRIDHPTADQVYESVKTHIPQTSRRTVYRVLETLVEVGLVRRVHHPGATARFDARMGRHHHLVCVRCNRIVDFDNPILDHIDLPQGKPGGFEISDFSVQFMGICPECREEKKSTTQ